MQKVYSPAFTIKFALLRDNVKIIRYAPQLEKHAMLTLQKLDGGTVGYNNDFVGASLVGIPQTFTTNYNP